MARSRPATSSTRLLVGVVAEPGGQGDLHGRRLAVRRRQGVHRLDAVSGRRGQRGRPRRRARRRRPRRRRPRPGASSSSRSLTCSDSNDAAPSRSASSEENRAPAAPKPRTRTTSHPRRHAPGGPEGQGCESRRTCPERAPAALAESSGHGWDQPGPAPGRTHEARLVGVDDRLHPVAQAELHEHPPDVGLHRRLADEQLRADLGVVAAAPDQLEDLLLAGRQTVEPGGGRRRRGRRPAGEVLDQAAGDRRGQQGLARGHDAHRVHEVLTAHVLQQEAAGPRPQRLEHVLVEVERGEDDHLHRIGDVGARPAGGWPRCRRRGACARP